MPLRQPRTLPWMGTLFPSQAAEASGGREEQRQSDEGKTDSDPGESFPGESEWSGGPYLPVLQAAGGFLTSRVGAAQAEAPADLPTGCVNVLLESFRWEQKAKKDNSGST